MGLPEARNRAEKLSGAARDLLTRSAVNFFLCVFRLWLGGRGECLPIAQNERMAGEIAVSRPRPEPRVSHLIPLLFDMRRHVPTKLFLVGRRPIIAHLSEGSTEARAPKHYVLRASQPFQRSR